MALVHDMAERLVGDITLLHKDIIQAEKSRREEATMGYIAQLLPGVTDINNTFTTLFREDEENQTPEAQLVHDIDKLEMVLHMFEYERCHQRVLSEFYHVMHSIRLPEMRDWGLMMMMKEREAFRAAASKGETEHDPAKM
jgi:putative hydrolase of HD superfamily